MKHEFPTILFVGSLLSDWWGQLDMARKAVAALAATAVVAWTLSWFTHDVVEAFRENPTRHQSAARAIAHLDSASIRDSIRIALVEAQVRNHEALPGHPEGIRRLGELERKLDQMSGRIDRVLCWVSRNADPICLMN